MHSWQGGGGDFKNNDDSNNNHTDDDNHDSDNEDVVGALLKISLSDTATNMWLDAFLAGRGDGAIFVVGNLQKVQDWGY